MYLYRRQFFVNWTDIGHVRKELQFNGKQLNILLAIQRYIGLFSLLLDHVVCFQFLDASVTHITYLSQFFWHNSTFPLVNVWTSRNIYIEGNNDDVEQLVLETWYILGLF
jgi:hypothetical protein